MTYLMMHLSWHNSYSNEDNLIPEDTLPDNVEHPELDNSLDPQEVAASVETQHNLPNPNWPTVEIFFRS